MSRFATSCCFHWPFYIKDALAPTPDAASPLGSAPLLSATNER